MVADALVPAQPGGCTETRREVNPGLPTIRAIAIGVSQ